MDREHVGWKPINHNSNVLANKYVRLLIPLALTYDDYCKFYAIMNTILMFLHLEYMVNFIIKYPKCQQTLNWISYLDKM